MISSYSKSFTKIQEILTGVKAEIGDGVQDFSAATQMFIEELTAQEVHPLFTIAFILYHDLNASHVKLPEQFYGDFDHYLLIED